MTWTIADLNRAKQMYDQGLSPTEIGAILGRSRFGVSAALKSAGVKLRTGRPKMTNPWQETDRVERVEREKIILGSAKLLQAIERAGVRP